MPGRIPLRCELVTECERVGGDPWVIDGRHDVTRRGRTSELKYSVCAGEPDRFRGVLAVSDVGTVPLWKRIDPA